MSSHNKEVMHFVYQCIFSSKTPSYPLYIIGCKNSIWIICNLKYSTRRGQNGWSQTWYLFVLLKYFYSVKLTFNEDITSASTCLICPKIYNALIPLCKANSIIIESVSLIFSGNVEIFFFKRNIYYILLIRWRLFFNL